MVFCRCFGGLPSPVNGGSRDEQVESGRVSSLRDSDQQFSVALRSHRYNFGDNQPDYYVPALGSRPCMPTIVIGVLLAW
jgi:hypothetical protein